MISQIPFYFSVAGPEPGIVDSLVPSSNAADLSIDPYQWGTAPNANPGNVNQYRSRVQMLNVCNGSSKENWCWITNETRQDAHFDEPFRSNLAAISSPSQQPPFASHGQYSTDFRLKQAMDPEIHNRDRPTSWVSGVPANVTPSQFITVNLHPVDVDTITITWHPGRNIDVGDGQTIAVAYPQVYTLRIRTSDSGAWQTVYTTSGGNGGVDTILLSPPLHAEAIRLEMNQPDQAGYYAIENLGVYGQVQEQLFQPQRPTSLLSLPDWIAANPGLTWLMANEPDNYDLRFGDGIPPDDYGRFYAQVATLIRDADKTAEIVFCQGTVAGAVTNDTDDQFPHGRGPAYCAQAVTETTTALSANNSPYTLTALVDAVSTHQYIYGKITTTLNLEAELGAWKGKLASFRSWVNSVPGLAYKPLYLTEYGDFNNPCPTGSPNEETPNDRCGKDEDGNAFWGAHYQEGFWAIIYHTTDYFLSPNNRDGQWRAAWWFFLSDVRADAVKGNLLQVRDPLTFNPNGDHYRSAIRCLALDEPEHCPSPP